MNDLHEHFKTGATTVCRAWIVTREDGKVFGFTDHDEDLVVDSTLCRASSGFDAGAIQKTTGLAVDNTEVSGALSDDAVSDIDIQRGYWDAAKIKSMLVNWTDPSQKKIVFFGSFGEITRKGSSFSVELRGLSDAMNRKRGRVYQPFCDASLGDARCRKALGSKYILEAEIITATDDDTFEIELQKGYAEGWFKSGKCEIRSGSGRGLVFAIRTDRNLPNRRKIEVWPGNYGPIEAGDMLRLEAGCDKLKATCKAKFDNLINFQGFPDIPGEDWLVRQAD